MKEYLFTNSYSVCFNTLFSALQSLSAVLQGPFLITPNQHPVIAQALKQNGHKPLYTELDYNGLIVSEAQSRHLVVTDYAGILPDIATPEITLWSNGAGFLERPSMDAITVIDLKTLNPLAPTNGAVVICEDPDLCQALRTYAGLGIIKGVVWNDKIDQGGIDGLMSPLSQQYWQEHYDDMADALKRVEAVVHYYRERFQPLPQLDLIPTDKPRFFPVKLAPELLCPKEEIYEALLASHINASVPFKPLYRYQAFATESIRSCEAFYRAVLALPVHGIDMDEARRIADTFLAILEQYRYRSCSF